MEHALVGDAVDDFDGLLVNRLCGSFIACFDCFQYFFHCSAECGTQASVVGALFDGLAGTFACLCAVCHIGISWKKNKFCKRAILKGVYIICKPFLSIRPSDTLTAQKNGKIVRTFSPSFENRVIF